MRFGLVLVAIGTLAGACGGRSGGGPAWPKASEREVDGGESIAPRQPSVIAEVKKADAAKADDKLAEVKPATPTATTTPTPTPTTPTITAPEDVIIIDDIIIEIDD